MVFYDFKTLSGTRSSIFTPKRYNDHPRLFNMGTTDFRPGSPLFSFGLVSRCDYVRVGPYGDARVGGEGTKIGEEEWWGEF